MFIIRVYNEKNERVTTTVDNSQLSIIGKFIEDSLINNKTVKCEVINTSKFRHSDLRDQPPALVMRSDEVDLAKSSDTNLNRFFEYINKI